MIHNNFHKFFYRNWGGKLWLIYNKNKLIVIKIKIKSQSTQLLKIFTKFILCIRLLIL